ncbi:MAG: tetratricopeptide repeat protein [Proteobacteria bacterium]|nr:tetratricopeptide repeat protein [Desulfobulbaceae bacterium]MBU4151397.1 tetratricopeptide repeat protein [Pseudomonadota bacterium]
MIKFKQIVWVIMIVGGFVLTSCSPPTPHMGQPIGSVLTVSKEKPVVSSVQDGEEQPDTQCSYFYFLWGKTAETEGRYDEALEAYEKAVVCDSGADYVIRNLTVLLLRMNRKQQAMDWVEKLMQADPEDQKVKLFQADLLGAMGEGERAIAIYQAHLVLEPKDTEVLLKLGKQYLSSLDYLKARDSFEQLVLIEPDSLLGFYYLARLYRELKFNQKAAEAYQKTLDLNWTSPLALEAADFYESQKMTEQAVALYQELLSDDESSEDAANRLVRLYLIQKQSDKALAVLKELRGNALDNQKVDLAIGRIFMDQKKYQEAITIFREMLTRDPQLNVARSLLALALYEAGDRAQAKSVLLAVKPDEQGFDDALSLLVKMYADDKEFSKAIGLLTKVISASKGETQNYEFAISSLYEEQGKLVEAEKALLESLRRYPEEESGYFTYGMFLERHGRLAEAIAQMEKVLILNPDDPLALNYIGYSWAERGVRLPEALEYVKKAVEQRPDDGFIQDSLGWVYFKMGDLQQAAETLVRAIALEPEDPTIHEHLGDVYLALQKPQLALDTYKKSLELSNKDEDKARVSAKIGAITP